jgi:hypothetical protein
MKKCLEDENELSKHQLLVDDVELVLLVLLVDELDARICCYYLSIQ